MQTDPFSPVQLADGTTERALTLVLERTAFRVRVLTKNAVVGRGRWVDFFAGHPGRFVVGLSTGTLDDEWARRVEVGTSSPSGRLEALGNLQRAGVPTYGMLCPVFPDVIFSGRLDELVDRVSPAAVEAVWAEPFNDRDNWQKVRDSYPEGSAGREWLTEVSGLKNRAAWSRYATELYRRLRGKARGEGWLPKLKYLLYEDMIIEEDAGAFTGLEGVLLQSKPGPEGLSRNRHIASLQRARVTERR